MQANVVWSQGMAFAADVNGHQVNMDASAPIGKGSAPTPKELVAIGIAGCTGMDVAALFKKYKQPVESFEISVHTEQTSGHPAIFKTVELVYKVTGAVEPERFKEAVMLSQTKYCGVSAMISAKCPITYKMVLNGETIGEGSALFE